MFETERSVRVLIVDDCRDTTATLSVLLKAWGHDPSVAHDGPAALVEAAMQTPDVVLLDIGLPGMNGWELARQLRALPGMQAARLVAMSGYGQSQDQLHSFEVGCELHLLKPVDPAILERILKEHSNVSRTCAEVVVVPPTELQAPQSPRTT